MENPYKDKTPGQLADHLLILAAEYGQLSEELGDILQWKDVNWIRIRDTVNSDRQADKVWGQTESGMRERQLEIRMKNITIQKSSIKTYLTVKENEAKNLY